MLSIVLPVAVVPGLMGPLQALVAILPQIFAVGFGLFGSLLSTAYWRERARRHWKLGLLLALGALALLWATADHRQSVVATATPDSPAHQEWLSFRGTLSGGGGGVLNSQPFASMPETVWSHQDKDGCQYISSPVAVNGRVYIGSALMSPVRPVGAVECFDAGDGRLLWRSLTRYPVFGSPIVADGRVYCGEGLHEHQDSQLVCLDALTGKTLWAVPTRGHVEAAPTLDGQRLIFAAGGDGLHCVEAASGRSLWLSRCGHCDCSAAVAGGRVYVGTAYGDNSAVCLDLASGQKRWAVRQDLPVWGHPAVAGDRVVFGLGNGTFGGGAARPRGALVCLEAEAGRQCWRVELADSVNTSLVVDGQDVLFGSRDGYVYCCALGDGRLRWKAFCGFPVLSSLVVCADQVLAAGGDGRLHALSRLNGQESWSYLVADVPCESSPVLSDNRLYLGTGTSLQCLAR